MNGDEILYVDHDKNIQKDTEVVYIEHEGDATRLGESGIAKKKAEISNENPNHQKEPKTNDRSLNENMGADKTAEAKEPEEEIATEKSEQDTVAEQPSLPLDKIDQITNSSVALPLPSNDTEEIEPLLPY